MPAQKTEAETLRARQATALRRALLSAAVKMLTRGGPDALNLRDLGAAVGATTKVVYSHFGGKPGLIAAIYADGFGRLATSMRAAVDDARAPRKKIEAAARAYRAFALANAEVFHLMFGPMIKTLAPGVADRAAAVPSLAVFTDAFELSGLAPTLARGRARALWASIHGPVALELTGWLVDGEAAARFEDGVRLAVSGL